jgi:hypothetical protein
MARRSKRTQPDHDILIPIFHTLSEVLERHRQIGHEIAIEIRRHAHQGPRSQGGQPVQLRDGRPYNEFYTEMKSRRRYLLTPSLFELLIASAMSHPSPR